jgi:hypothetical protein
MGGAGGSPLARLETHGGPIFIPPDDIWHGNRRLSHRPPPTL